MAESNWQAEGWELINSPEDLEDSEIPAGWEPVLNVPPGPAGSGVPYTNPQKLIAQGNAAHKENMDRIRNEMRLAAIREQYGSLETQAISAGIEASQPVIGMAGILAKMSGNHDTSKKILDYSDKIQGRAKELQEARPIASMAGMMSPYMLTGPLAQMGYMKGVSKLAPGVMKGGLTRPIAAATLPYIAEGGILGTLNPQQSGPAMAAMGAVGGYAGQKFMAPLSAAPTNLSKYDQSMLDIAKSWKLKDHKNKSIYDYMLAGARTGNLAAKEFDDALAANSASRLPIAHRFDVPQEELTRKVLKETGLDSGTVGESALYNNRRALGKEYDTLERSSSPIMTDKILDNLEVSRQAFTDLNLGRESKMVDNLETEFLALVDEADMIPLTAYKGFKNKLKRIIGNFENKPLDPEQAATKSYAMDMLSHLRDTMKYGSKDPKALAKWDALDRKFAKTRFLEENKIIKDGTINFKRLYSVLEAKRPGDLAGLTDDTAKAASLGRYVEQSRVSTLGERSKINSELGARQGSKGLIGHIASLNRRLGIDASIPLQFHQWAHPRKGLLHLPELTPLMAGAPVGSAMARSSDSSRRLME